MKYKAYYDNECYSEFANKPSCVLKDTGNGFKIKFPAYRSCEQDIYMSLDYAQAAYLKECLNQWDDK